MLRRRYLRIFVLAICCAGLLQLMGWLPFAGQIPMASAHAFVIGSDPIDGSTISKAPAMVRVYFDAPVAGSSQVSVLAFPPGAPASGIQVNAGRSFVSPDNARELDAPLIPASKLPQGGYEVKWTAVSITDGHTTSGLIGFNLGQSSLGLVGTPTLGPTTSNHLPQLDLQGALSVAWDWLVLLALLFWVGILLTDYFIIPRSAPSAFLSQARKRSLPLQALCLTGLLVGEVINLILRATTFTRTLSSSGSSLDVITRFALNTNYGRLWLARVILLVVALLFLWWNGYRQSLQADASTPSLSKNSKNFRQLRQQARPDATDEATPASPAPTPSLARSQARVTGAVATHVSPARGTTAALPRITAHGEATEAHVHQPSRWQGTGWLALAGLILLTMVLSNELIQLAPLPISAGVLYWLALAAQSIWFGCAAYLGLTLLPLLSATDPDHYAETLVNILKRALPFLLSAIGVLLVSELFLNEATLQTPEQFLTDPYGRALLAQDALLALMLILTGSILFSLLPKFQRQTVLLPVVNAEMPARRARKAALEKSAHTIRRAFCTLTGLAATVLICVALMNFFAPPVVFPNVDYTALTNQPSSSSTPATPTSQTQSAGNVAATLQILPARVGVSNQVILVLNDAQGKPVTDATVKLNINMEIMDMGTANATINGGSSTYSTTFNANQVFTMAGPWVIQVEIDRPNQQTVHLTFHVLVGQ